MKSSLLVVAGLHRRRRTISTESDESKLNSFLNHHTQFNTQERLDLIDEVVRSTRETGIATYLDVEKEKNYVVQDRALDALIQRANQKIVRETNYVSLFWCLSFSISFVMMQSFQGDVALIYNLKSSAHTTMIQKLTTVTSNSGLQFGTSIFGERGTLTSNSNFYDWLNSSVLRSIFTQPICGVSNIWPELILNYGI
jgi:hypothetical protein